MNKFSDGTSFTPAVNAFDPSTGGLRLEGDTRPILLKGLRAAAGQATFSVQVNGGNPSTLSFLFGAEDIDRADRVDLLWNLDDSGNGVYGYQKDGSALTLSSLDGPPVQTVNPDVGDTMWVRVSWFDGGITWVNRLINDTGTPTEDDWSSCTDFMEFDSPSDAGGLLGFELLGGSSDIGDNAAWDGFTINNLTVKSLNSDATVNKTELVEPFTLDSSGYADETTTSDANGNQTYDGTQAYTYDAWNRLMTVARAYRDSGGTLQTESAFETMSYDGRGRRIKKTSNYLNIYIDYYLDGDSVVEERNGSNAPMKQFVWGKRYIDELVQISIGSNPTTPSSTCDLPYWVCQDANWNVLGVVDSDGVLRERYEYTPYGERSVFTSYGTNDPNCMDPTSRSQGATDWDTTLCEVGHQGLFHDEESGLVYDRSRELNLSLGRFNQRDSFGGLYIDGPNLYQYVDSNPTNLTDPTGNCSPGFVCGKGYPASSGDPGAVWIGNGYYSPIPPVGSPWANNPNLAQQCLNNANKGPQKSCVQCDTDFANGQAQILIALARNGGGGMGGGLAGSGKGIIIGAILKGGSMGMGEVYGGSVWGPVGWVAGGVAVVGGGAIGWYDGSWKWQGYKDQMQALNEALARCKANCTGNKL